MQNIAANWKYVYLANSSDLCNICCTAYRIAACPASPAVARCYIPLHCVYESSSKIWSATQDPTTVSYGSAPLASGGRNGPSSQTGFGTQDSVDDKFGALNFGEASPARPPAGQSYQSDSVAKGVPDGAFSSSPVRGVGAADDTTDREPLRSPAGRTGSQVRHS